jgi:ATP-binding cassette subfamily B multidrug efflux pump
MFGFFESLVNPFPDEAPRTPPRKLAAFIYHYSRPLLPWLVLVAVLTAAISAVEVMFLGYLGTLVDWLAESSRETFIADHFWRLAGMLALVVIGFPMLVLAQSLLIHQTLFGNYPMIVRWLSHRYVLQQSIRFFQDEFAGRLSQKVMQTALAIRETVMKLIEAFVYVVVYFTGAMVLFARAEPWLMVPLIAWLAGYIAILVFFVPRLRAISMAQADARAEMSGRIVDSYANIQTIKLFAHTRREREYARDAMGLFMNTVHRQMRLVTILTVSLQTLNALLLASVAGIAIFSWHQTLISLGAIAVAIALAMRIRSMSEWVLWEVASLFENIGTVQDGINTLTRPMEVTDQPDARKLVFRSGEIRFENVRFSYGKGKPVINDLSLTLKPGEKIGLVGLSGAGKSTLASLLLRFHDLDGGRILIDGQDISGVSQDSLREQIGMVTQDTSLLHRTIRENIGYGQPDAEGEAIEVAARQAHADQFIAGLSDQKGRTGYDVQVGERGVKLSGGQRQRIALARVLLKDAPILILDEATSALDSQVESHIQEQLEMLMDGKTVLVIAHRLSTIAMLDRLVVMDEGRIIETGTHDELLRRCGLYAGLWQRQSGGMIGLDRDRKLSMVK